MDYSVVLNDISANQAEIISLLSVGNDVLKGIFLLFSIYFIYVFIRNFIKIN